LYAAGAGSDMCFLLAGSVHYVAPEVLEMSYEGSKYDVWSCGVVAFILLSGFSPFEGDNDFQVMQQVTMGLHEAVFKDPAWQNVSDEAKDFVRHLLTYDQDERPTAEQALKHAWIQNSIKTRRESFMQSHGQSSIACLENMQDFGSGASLALKQAVYVFIGSQLLTKDEREEIDKVFRGMDADCDGKLSKLDIKQGYERFFDKELSDDETDKMFDRINISKTGFIDYTEFVVAAMEKSKILDIEKLRSAFRSFDHGNKGYISSDDLKHSLSGVIALPVDNEDGLDADGLIQKMMSQVDVEGDGVISFQNFTDMMMFTGAGTGKTEKSAESDSQGRTMSYDFASESFTNHDFSNMQPGGAFTTDFDDIMEE
jgi:calcium-dependent protein kinase